MRLPAALVQPCPSGPGPVGLAGFALALALAGGITSAVLPADGTVAKSSGSTVSATLPAPDAAAMLADRSSEEQRASRSRRAPAPVAAAPAPPVEPAPEAQAPAVPPPAPPQGCQDGDPEARGQRVLATLPSSWRSVGMPVLFGGPRQGYYGEVRTDRRTVNIYVRSCAAESDSFLRHVIAHELGHAWDITQMSDSARAEYKRMRGIAASTPWFGCSGCTDLATPAGDFAEVYGQWLRGGSSNMSKLAGDPSPAALDELAARFFS